MTAEDIIFTFHPRLNLTKLPTATSYIMGKKLPFIGTNEDQQLPLGNDVVFPGTGAIVAAVACAVEKQPDQVMGKPHQHIFECLQVRINVTEGVPVFFCPRYLSPFLFYKHKPTLLTLR